MVQWPLRANALQQGQRGGVELMPVLAAWHIAGRAYNNCKTGALRRSQFANEQTSSSASPAEPSAVQGRPLLVAGTRRPLLLRRRRGRAWCHQNVGWRARGCTQAGGRCRRLLWRGNLCGPLSLQCLRLRHAVRL